MQSKQSILLLSKKLMLFMAVFMLAMTVKADVLGEYSFEGTLGDKIPVKLKFCINGDGIAVGEIYYPKAKNPAPILVVGGFIDDWGYYLNEYQEDGTITGSMSFKIEGEDDADGPHIEEGKWTNPRTGKEFKMKNMYSNHEMIDVTDYLDYEVPENIGSEYVYSKWNENYQSMMGGNVKFSRAGEHKLNFEVSNCFQNIAEGKNDPDRPAELGQYTYNFFYYENVNECGYGFCAHFFKKFVVLQTTSGNDTLGCFGMGAAFDGVYLKVKQ
jgi:hypothetical protein